jgi:hypothetical protein
MPHFVAVAPAGLMIVAKAVAGAPACTERLDGSTEAATRGGVAGPRHGRDVEDPAIGGRAQARPRSP